MILALLKKNPALSQDIKDAFKPDRQMKFKTKTILRTMQKQGKKTLNVNTIMKCLHCCGQLVQNPNTFQV